MMRCTSVLGIFKLAASVRTLQRRLADLDTTFSEVVEEARMKSANQLVTQSDYSLKQIASQLGYSEQAHFTRAFRRWNGVTPSAFRRLHLQADGSA